MLAFYAGRLATVEINTTFYGTVAEDVIQSWVDAVPESFRFAVKAPRRVTHVRRERLMQADLSVFVSLLNGLGDRLGPVLFQFPPTAAYQAGRLEAFLPRLPRHWRVAFQFRHPSWHIEPVTGLIEEWGGAVCHADGEPEPGPLGRGAFCYFRLRGEDYSPVALRAWTRRFRGYAEAGRDVFAYFKHERNGPAFAESIRTSARRWRASAV
jgi:uncharacterized protein YecE (DUF72 family)